MRLFKRELAPPTPARGANRDDVTTKNARNKKQHGVTIAAATAIAARPYHWQTEHSKKTSADDMVLLTKISESAITENLKKRFTEDKIYTYIGPVLVAVNPFKQLPYFGEKEIAIYQGASHYEVPPHIYALADVMYRNMIVDSDSQCVIISGESGAGKTVSAKFIMQYLTRISGGGPKVQHMKDIILESNPLLEAFGNAKTVRNNNSSRFGKYVEIQFSRGGEPMGGKISNFLLEKSRVHFLSVEERNFHIFYQLCTGADDQMAQELGITTPDYYYYLSQSGVYHADCTNDSQDFKDTMKAMDVMGISKDMQYDILRVVAAILHMGNITFKEEANHAQITNTELLEYPAYLLSIDTESLGKKLTSRVFDSKWGSKSECVNVTLNEQQACFARDAWAKGLYARLFDFIVQTVNNAMVTPLKEINLGILDIYGFEIFNNNGFEQFCINYVNEKLQQIFIDLTLKGEQEEYSQEGIRWTPIDYFNNKIVCDLIESKRPPGIMSILDDTCATMNAVSVGADADFKNKMGAQVGNNPHYQPFKDGFTIKHYAGCVSYYIEGFCEKNRDVLFVDIIEVMQQSKNTFIRNLFKDDVSTVRGRPTTVGIKIRNQANELVSKLTQCIPHYIRCVKPNETKRPRDWDDAVVKHQVEYLGLKENIKVKRAGFAYRRPFEKFLQRYSMLSRETWLHYNGDPRNAIHIIMKNVNMDCSQYQIGKTKIFVKDPESLYMLEECRERKFDHYARILQRAFKKYFSKQIYMKEKLEGSNLLLNKKARRANSINRTFYGDYIGVDMKPGLMELIPRREKICFAMRVSKFDRRFKKTKRDLIVTKVNIYLIGREKVKKGPKKGQIVETIKRNIPIGNLVQVTLSPYQDDFVLLHVRNDYESFLEIPFKTEFLVILNRRMKEICNREINLNFSKSSEYKVKKTRFGIGGTRQVEFQDGPKDLSEVAVLGSKMVVRTAVGLPSNTRPFNRTYDKRATAINSVQNGAARFHKVTNSSRRPPPVAEPLQFNAQQRAQKIPTAFVLPNQASHHVPPPPSEPAPENQPSLRRIANKAPPLKPPVLKTKPKINQVKALYSYDARDIDELSFAEGDLLELVQEDASGWWTCRFHGKQGFCPGNYLEKV